MPQRWTTVFAAVVLVVATAGVGSAQLESIEELRAKAERGDAEAQRSLGSRYTFGLGVPQDDTEAVRWYRLAADQGYAPAQNNLGSMYENGYGVPQDETEAVRLYRLAAEQGYGPAHHNLGYIYHLGLGVPQDFVRAHLWYDLAAARLSSESREESASYRDIVARQMTPAQIAEAKRLAREWDEAHPR